ncbi:MAG: type I glyceraldehyde-3-phosphate dehydrogenase [Candidatus Bathyarchaeota archaeon]|nr:type I glyceraldehyde-3-phosphate dehydrogenase [Candidatus Bathyarchaeota archaeon]
MKKVGINGLGRIGRSFLRRAFQDKDFFQKVELIAVNDLTDAKTLCHLLKYDSIHGIFNAEIMAEKDFIIINNKKIRVLSEKDPESLPWLDLGVEIVLESTGIFSRGEDAAKHIKAGSKKVVLSAPGKGNKIDFTVVMGVNEKNYDEKEHNIISNSSCTTNCLAPMAKVLNDSFEINQAFMSTIHAYTNDQRLLDLPHKDIRRARAAALSIIPTTTGATQATVEVIPELRGKLDGLAFRVPVANGSIVDLVAELSAEVNKEQINEAFRSAANKLKGILEYSEEPLVSSDIIGNIHSCVFDALSTMVLGGESNKMVKVLGWYDNEWGYSSRLVDLIKFIA